MIYFLPHIDAQLQQKQNLFFCLEKSITNKYKNKEQIMPSHKKPCLHQVKGNNMSLKSHQEGTPQKKKMETAQKMMYVQHMLGREIKKYNLLINKDDGLWFSSEDDLHDGFIFSVLEKLEKENPFNCGGWRLMYLLKSKGVGTNHEKEKFFCYCNVSSPYLGIDKYEYFTWKEYNEMFN